MTGIIGYYNMLIILYCAVQGKQKKNHWREEGEGREGEKERGKRSKEKKRLFEELRLTKWIVCGTGAHSNAELNVSS